MISCNWDIKVPVRNASCQWRSHLTVRVWEDRYKITSCTLFAHSRAWSYVMWVENTSLVKIAFVHNEKCRSPGMYTRHMLLNWVSINMGITGYWGKNVFWIFWIFLKLKIVHWSASLCLREVILLQLRCLKFLILISSTWQTNLVSLSQLSFLPLFVFLSPLAMIFPCYSSILYVWPPATTCKTARLTLARETFVFISCLPTWHIYFLSNWRTATILNPEMYWVRWRTLEQSVWT